MGAVGQIFPLLIFSSPLVQLRRDGTPTVGAHAEPLGHVARLHQVDEYFRHAIRITRRVNAVLVIQQHSHDRVRGRVIGVDLRASQIAFDDTGAEAAWLDRQHLDAQRATS